MTVWQTNVWTCEVCDYSSTTVKETSPYADPVVVPPEGEEWGYVFNVDTKEELLACPACMAKKKEALSG